MKNRTSGIRRGVLCLCILLQMCIMSSPVCAVEADTYTYTVTLYAGNGGTFAGGASSMVKTGLHAGDRVVLDAGAVQVTDSRYYVRGIRKSGRDNHDRTGAVEEAAVEVTEDAEYVVAYGIRGEQVRYTVHYRDSEGNDLEESRTYYGNVGDKPVVAFRYIEGYRPQAYNLTKTLVKQEAENVFVFEYERNPEETLEEEEPAAPAQEEEPGVSGGGPADAGEAGSSAGNGAGTPLATGTAGTAAPLTAINDDRVPAAEEPEELTDLDDEDVPLAGMKQKDGTENTVRYALTAAGAAVLLAAAGLFLWMKRRKRQQEPAVQAASDAGDVVDDE